MFPIYIYLERENRQDISDSEDAVGNRLQQDVVSHLFKINMDCTSLIYIILECVPRLCYNMIHLYIKDYFLQSN